MKLLILRHTTVPKPNGVGCRYAPKGELVDVENHDEVCADLIRQQQAREVKPEEVLGLIEAFKHQQEQDKLRSEQQAKQRDADEARKTLMAERWASFIDAIQAQFQAGFLNAPSGAGALKSVKA